MSAHPVPKAQIETIKNVIEGYYQAANVGEIVTDKDVSNTSSASEDTVRRQKKFLADIGVLDKDGHDYTLLEPGRKAGHALAYGRETDAIETINGLLAGWEVTDDLKNDMRDETRSRDEVIDTLAYLTETDVSSSSGSSRRKTGIEALADLYQWVGILTETKNSDFQLTNTNTQERRESLEEDETENSDSESLGPSPSGKTIKDSVSTIPSSGNGSVEFAGDDDILSINIDLTGEENPENIKNLVIAIREGLHHQITHDISDTNSRDIENDHSLDEFEANE